MISEEKLIGWLIGHIDMEVSCYEDLEMTEGERNDYHRGKADAFQELLDAVYNRNGK
jgi:hypothetical protein